MLFIRRTLKVWSSPAPWQTPEKSADSPQCSDSDSDSDSWRSLPYDSYSIMASLITVAELLPAVNFYSFNMKSNSSPLRQILLIWSSFKIRPSLQGNLKITRFQHNMPILPRAYSQPTLCLISWSVEEGGPNRCIMRTWQCICLQSHYTHFTSVIIFHPWSRSHFINTVESLTKWSGC